MKKLFTLCLLATALFAQAKVYTLADLLNLVGTVENTYEGTDGPVSETVGISYADGAYLLTMPTKLADGVSGITFDEGNIILSKSYLTIKAGNDLKVNEGEVLNFGANGYIELEGGLIAENATFGAQEGQDGSAKGFRLYGEGTSVTLKNCTFNYVGINFGNGGEQGNFVAESCTFNDHNSKSGNAAINFTSYSKGNIIKSCIFTDNQLSSIASGSNVSIGVTITDCTFNKSFASNRLYPSINVSTSTEDITIENNTIVGPAENTRAGGIAVSNLLGGPTSGTVYVRKNHVQDCSYGITLTGPGNIFMEENTVLNNKYIANVNLGGSGLNITCNTAGKVAKAYLRGNHIEGNVWGVTVIGNVDINAGKIQEVDTRGPIDPSAEDYNPGENVFVNNGNGDPFVQYDWYNNTAATSYAQGNTWSVDVQDFEHIAEVIVDKADIEELGEVIYMPAAGSTSISQVTKDTETATGRFNILGQPVGDNFRGIVIENGKKVLVK